MLKQKRLLNVYEIYEGDNLIAKGFTDEVAEIVGCTTSTLIRYAQENKTINKKYTAKLIDKVWVDYSYELKPKKKKNNLTYTLDYLYRHLTEYGNTVLNKNPEKYIEELKVLGLDCTYKKVKNLTIDSNRVLGHYYIIEVMKNED